MDVLAGASPPYAAVIFDLDGVVIDTAAIHAAAWKALLDEFLAARRNDVVRALLGERGLRVFRCAAATTASGWRADRVRDR